MFEVSWQGWQWWLGWLGWPLHCLIFESSRDHPKPSSNNEQPTILTFSLLRHHKRILRQLPGLQRALFGTNHCETYLWAWRHCLQRWRPGPVTPSHWSAMVTLGLSECHHMLICCSECVVTCVRRCHDWSQGVSWEQWSLGCDGNQSGACLSCYWTHSARHLPSNGAVTGTRAQTPAPTEPANTIANPTSLDHSLS